MPWPDGGVDLEWHGGAKRVLGPLKGRRAGAEHGRWRMRVLCSVSPESPLNLTCFSPPVSSALLQLIEEDGRPISASWQQEGVEALVQREMSVSAVSHTPSTHTHTHTHKHTRMPPPQTGPGH